jgi:hypothetical protein
MLPWCSLSVSIYGLHYVARDVYCPCKRRIDFSDAQYPLLYGIVTRIDDRHFQTTAGERSNVNTSLMVCMPVGAGCSSELHAYRISNPICGYGAVEVRALPRLRGPWNYL